jgi:hypothetical protein
MASTTKQTIVSTASSASGASGTTFTIKSLRDKSSKARQSRETESSALKSGKDENVRRLMKQFLNRHLDGLLTPEQMEERAGKGQSSGVIAFGKPPRKEKEVVDGEEEWVYSYPASETHFAGYDKDKEETDHSVGGVPIMSLYQGFVDTRNGSKGGERSRPMPDPKSLPDGLTLLDHLNVWFLDQAGGNIEDALTARGVWNGKEQRFEVHQVWDQPGWDAWQAKIQARRNDRRKERGAVEATAAEGPTMTMDEFMAKKAGKKSGLPRHTRTPAPANDEEGYTQVHNKRR